MRCRCLHFGQASAASGVNLYSNHPRLGPNTAIIALLRSATTRGISGSIRAIKNSPTHVDRGLNSTISRSPTRTTRSWGSSRHWHGFEIKKLTTQSCHQLMGRAKCAVSSTIGFHFPPSPQEQSSIALRGSLQCTNRSRRKSLIPRPRVHFCLIHRANTMQFILYLTHCSVFVRVACVRQKMTICPFTPGLAMEP